MENFDDIIRKRSEYKQARAEKYKYDSKKIHRIRQYKL